MPIGKEDVIEWLNRLQKVYAENRQFLTDLDAAIGDADHGINMDRGFTAVRTEFGKNVPADLHAVLKNAGTVLIRTVGGAAGPLYGTFFLRAAAAVDGKSELNAEEIAAMFAAGIEGVQQRGKAVAGDKTMIDALLHAIAALRESLANGRALSAALDDAASAAESGMRATIPMQARKGRASYLGARSIGHQDPGATSSYMLLRAAADAWHERS